MPTGFSPSLAFGGGLAEGIQNANAAKVARQNQIDDEYRKLALATSFEEQHEDYTRQQNEKAAQQQVQDSYQRHIQDANIATGGALTASSTGQMQQAKNIQDASNPAITQVTGSPPATNTPVQAASAPVQGQGQIQQGNLAPLTDQSQGPNPTGNPPQQPTNPLQGAGTPPQTLNTGNPSQTNPLAPPISQDTSGANSNQGTVFPTSDQGTYAQTGKLNPQDVREIIALGAEKLNGKTNVDPFDLGYPEWRLKQAQTQAAIQKEQPAWEGSQQEINDAKNLGVPYFSDSHFNKLPAKQQFDIQEKDATREFGNPQDRQALASLPEMTRDLKTIYTLNTAITTGNLKAIPGAQNINDATDAYNALYDKITSRLAILQRMQGMGRMSVAELQADQKGFASTKIPNQANNAIILATLAHSQDKTEEYAYKAGVISANGHYDTGKADQIWQQYREQNPILDMSNPTNPRVLQYPSFNSWYYGDGSQKKTILDNTGGIVQNNSSNTAQTQQSGPKVIGTWNPQTGKIE